MVDEVKKPDHIKLVDAPEPDSVFDDIEALRKTATVKVSRRVIPVNVAVKKPPNNVFFRCHPDPAMSLDASIIIGDGGADDYYFVTPLMLNHHVILPRLRKVTIAVVYTWPGGVVARTERGRNPYRLLEIRAGSLRDVQREMGATVLER